MRTEMFVAIAIAVGAAVGVRVLDGRMDAHDNIAPQAEASRTAPARPAQIAVAKAPAWGHEVRISASRDQHYYVDASVNRTRAQFLVDTGASYVAMRESDASAAGVYFSNKDFTYPVRTANGETKAAFVTLEEIDIDGIRIDGVKAFVLRDKQLAVNLLGMSFLNRLESVEARRGELVLRG
ncbi:MAG: TIGR02281 family clan AA aspartic protease [Pseudomonadota bacterium]